MKRIILNIFLIMMVVFSMILGCKQESSKKLKPGLQVKSEKKTEEVKKEKSSVSVKQEEEKMVFLTKEEQIKNLKEKNKKYGSMLSKNRESGDIRGIWHMESPEPHTRKFFGLEVKPTTGYCIYIYDDMKQGDVYFNKVNKVFHVKIEKKSKTKYAMIYKGREKLFQVVNLAYDGKGAKELIWFFDDEHKYNPEEGREQFKSGRSFYDTCTQRVEYDCSIKGCMKRVKDMDEIADAESEGPTGPE